MKKSEIVETLVYELARSSKRYKVRQNPRMNHNRFPWIVYDTEQSGIVVFNTTLQTALNYAEQLNSHGFLEVE
jgi:hypothetical protein